MKHSTKVQLVRYGILALAGLTGESAHAGIVSNSQGFVPLTVGAGQSGSINFGGTVGSIFRFAGITTSSFPSSANFVIQRGFDGANQQILSLSGNDPVRLGTNYSVSAIRPWVNASNGTENDIAGFSSGNWNGSGTVAGFLGIRFQSSALTSGYHYGYFDVVFDNTPSSANGLLTIRGWAYETDANTAIMAPFAPEPSSLLLAGLGMLSCGAAGIRSLRSQKKTSDTSTALDA
jgi:hypothetical protein